MPSANASMNFLSLFRVRILSKTVLAFIFFVCWSNPARPDELKNTVSKKILPSQRPFQAVQFLPEPLTAAVEKVAQPHPSFEGKVAAKDSLGRYVPLKLPVLPSALEYMKPTGLNRLGGPDIFVDFGSETSIAVNYDDDNNLVGMYNYWWSLSNSSDGNLSWTPRLFPSGIADGFPYDPWANAGNDSVEFFATLIRYHPTLSSVTHCIIGRSTDAGANFSLFFERTRNTFQDREMVDIDRTESRGGGSGTTHDDKVYLTYDDFPGGGSYNASYLQIISPTGTPLLEIQTSGISDNGYQMQPVAGITDGTFYLKAKRLSYNGVRIHEITNGGAGPNTFNKSILFWADVGQELGISGRPGVNGHRVDINGYLDIDRSGGPRRGYLYLISNRNPHPSDTTQDQGDVYLSVSADGATSWSSAILPTASGKTQYFPMLNIDEFGWIHVAYYQNDTGTVDGGVLNATAANLFYLFSYDGGNTWSAPVQVNDNANTLDYNDPPLDLSTHYYLIGDYAQIRVAETDSTKKAYLLWTGYDKDAWTKVFCTTLEYDKCWAKPGNANGADPIALPDVIHLANYVFDKDRPATSCLGSSPGNCWTPDPVCQGEVNGTPPIALPDVIHLANYVFDKDRPATSCLGSDPGNCWTPVASGPCCLAVQ